MKKKIRSRLLKISGVESVTVEKVYVVHIRASRHFADRIYEEEKAILKDHPKAKVDFNIEYSWSL